MPTRSRPHAIRIKQKTQARRLRFLFGRDEGARTHDLTDVDRALWPTELRLRIYLEYFSIISFYCQRLSLIFSFFIAFSDFFLFFGGYNAENDILTIPLYEVFLLAGDLANNVSLTWFRACKIKSSQQKKGCLGGEKTSQNSLFYSVINGL